MILDTLGGGDRAQLLELYARSVMFLHLGRCAEWVDLFEPQALVRCAPAGSSPPHQFAGRQELLELAQRMMRGEFDVALGVLAPPVRTRHSLSSMTFLEEGQGHVAGYAFLTVTTVGGAEPPRWLASGLYRDRFLKCPTGCWRFASRVYQSDAEAGSTLPSSGPTRPVTPVAARLR